MVSFSLSLSLSLAFGTEDTLGRLVHNVGIPYRREVKELNDISSSTCIENVKIVKGENGGVVKF